MRTQKRLALERQILQTHNLRVEMKKKGERERVTRRYFICYTFVIINLSTVYSNCCHIVIDCFLSLSLSRSKINFSRVLYVKTKSLIVLEYFFTNLDFLEVGSTLSCMYLQFTDDMRHSSSLLKETVGIVMDKMGTNGSMMRVLRTEN